MRRFVILLAALFAPVVLHAQFIASVAAQDDCAIEGAFAKDKAIKRDAGIHESVVIEKFLDQQNDPFTPFNESRKSADFKDIRFVYAHPELTPDLVQDEVFKQCLPKAKDPHSYVGKDVSTFKG